MIKKYLDFILNYDNAPKTIILAGTIASGKSTVCENLCKITEYTPFFEPVEEHPFLAEYYRYKHEFEESKSEMSLKNLQINSERTQFYFLSNRFRSHILAGINNKSILDRSIYEDLIFMEMLYDLGYIEKVVYQQVYLPLYNILTKIIKEADVMIYLYCDPKSAKDRCDNRGRKIEDKIKLEFLQRLGTYYNKWKKNYPYKMIEVNTLKYNLKDINSPGYIEILKKIGFIKERHEAISN